MKGIIMALCLLCLQSACAIPRQTIEIALVAPFEGRFRETGYAAFPAFRMALRQEIEAGGIGNYQVEFVAYNDNADPAFAERVARNVVLDDRVVAVIGHLRSDTTLAAMHVYTEAHLPLVVPDIPAEEIAFDPLIFRMGPSQGALVASLRACHAATAPVVAGPLAPFTGNISDATVALPPDFLSPAAPRLIGPAISGLCFATAAPNPPDLPAARAALQGFSDISGGMGPGPRSISAYDATRLVLLAIRSDTGAHGKPSRAGVAEALKHVDFGGLLGRISFDQNNVWTTAPVWVYQYDSTEIPRLIKP